MSGGPDSMALLLLGSAARPGLVEAATVDHALRSQSAAEAQRVADACAALGVPHSILTVEWPDKPSAAIQEQARVERYRLLAGWADEHGLDAVATAHHLDDQAETLLMRLVRGAGVQGLAGMRPVAPIPAPGASARLLRPLLGWRGSELLAVCEAAGLSAIEDPSNDDPRFERVRMRRKIAEADWLDPQGLARSARNLAAADFALRWAAEREWESQVTALESEILYRPAAPPEIRRRVLARAIEALSSEGHGKPFRGAEIDQLAAALSRGGTTTLRGVLCTGGEAWRFTPAPARKR